MHYLNEECLDSKWKCIALKSGHMPLKVNNALIFEFVYIIKYDTHLLKPKSGSVW